MLNDGEAFESRRTIAIDRCTNNIDWYERVGRNHRHRNALAQWIVIVLSGLTPVLVAAMPQSLTESSQVASLWRFCIALFPAIAAMTAALNSAFGWRDNYIRFIQTAELLKSEKTKFQTRVAPDYDSAVDDEAVLTNFVQNIERVIVAETSDWQGLMARTALPTPAAKGH